VNDPTTTTATTATTDTTTVGLSGAAVGEYHRQGWASLGTILDARDVDALLAACLAEQEPPPPDGRDESLFSYQKANGFEQMFRRRTDLRLRHAGVAEVVRKLAPVAAALIGEDVRVLSDNTLSKPPAEEGSRATVWHQDFPFLPLDRRGVLTMWVALQDVAAESGALRFLPRSHRFGPIGRVELVGDEQGLEAILRPDELAEVGEPVTTPVPRGGVTVHDGLLIHSALPNGSSAWRHAWTVRFMPASTRWTGAPIPIEGVEATILAPFSTFDHPRFLVGSPD